MTHLKNTLSSTIIAANILCSNSAVAAIWVAQPIVVHEWGVNIHNWKGDPARAGHNPDLPPHFYTDKKPGKAFPATSKVKNLPPDSGIRDKPLLYFYGKGPIGVEARFKFGHASAWYPQVNIYRDPEMVKGAKAPNWKAWQKKERRFNALSGKLSNVPDDPRFELVWHNLTLDEKLTPSLPAPSEEHWLNIARNVDATTVSNGKEHEKFIFYEGATKETPAITILPTKDNKTYQLLNTGKHPIYDVFIIYRKGDQRYVKHHPELKRGLVGTSFPNFKTEKFTSLTQQEFKKNTTELLIKTMITPKAIEPQKVKPLSTNVHAKPMMLRDPADPQGATLDHALYKKEAQGLEKIWRKDFFQQKGLTIIYRESPAYLDEAMPLNIYTDMRHYIELNRCGLVCNSNINLDKVTAVYEYATNPDLGNVPKIIQENQLLFKTYLPYGIMKIQQQK